VIDRHEVVVAGQEERSIGQAVDRRELAQGSVCRIRVIEEGGIETIEIEAADDVRCGLAFDRRRSVNHPSALGQRAGATSSRIFTKASGMSTITSWPQGTS
jgi:hypothetical protein